jgi:hypothetical protein
VTFSSKLSVGWTSSPVRAKENLQKLVFPSGINYNVKKEAFRTEKVNELFSINASLNSLSEDDIKENGGIKTTVSNLVGSGGHHSNLLINDLWKIQEFLEQNANILETL